MIPVTKSFLPPLDEYTQLLKGIWERTYLTNNGPLLLELEEKLKNYLAAKHFIFLNNGTSALQIAIKGLNLKGEIITTPFSYVATTSSIVWENCKVVFADIEESTLTIDPDKIEALITPQTSAILATHVYGIPCNIEKIEKIAKKHKLKVIYDAAHAFGVTYNGQPLTNYGDASTLSFHATKLFHTTEGGALITNDEETAHRFSYMRNFGHKGQEDFWGLGINAKNSEFHAAMGLCVFPHVQNIIDKRKELSELYDKLLLGDGLAITRPKVRERTGYNYAYYPVVFETEKTLTDVRDALNASFIYPRRYFYPSLSALPYVEKIKVPVAEAISPRVMCLPLYHELKTEDINKICGIIKKILKFK